MRLRLHRYRLPLRRIWRTARGRYTHRDGVIVLLADAPDLGLGDCAPLADAGTEGLRLAIARLSAWQHRLDTAAWDADALLAALDDAWPSETPAADMALETAALDLIARRQALPLRRLLADAAGDQVRVNSMLGALDGLSEDDLDRALGDGWRCLKLKVGTAPVHIDITRLHGLLPRLPTDVQLRLDANGAWSMADAQRVISALRAPALGSRIDCLEEPLRSPTDAKLYRLQATAPFPLALDESVPERLPMDPRQLPVRRLVLKPGVVGGLRPTLALARAALAAGREVVLSSLIESAVGLAATVQLAAALPGSKPQAGLHHGLGTASWLASDLAPAPRVEAGVLRLDDRTGVGLDPEEVIAGLG